MIGPQADGFRFNTTLPLKLWAKFGADHFMKFSRERFSLYSHDYALYLTSAPLNDVNVCADARET